MIFFDTNAIIHYLQGDAKVIRSVESFRRKSEVFGISTVTEVEIFSFPKLTIEQMIQIHLFLEEIHIVPVDSAIARDAANIRREFGVKTPDAIIAATALRYGGRLLSRDKTLKKIRSLSIIFC